MGKDTVIDDLRKLDGEQALGRILRLLNRLNESDRIRVIRSLAVFFETDIKGEAS